LIDLLEESGKKNSKKIFLTIGGNYRPFEVIQNNVAVKSVLGLVVQQTSIHGLKKFGKLGTQPKKMKYGIFLSFLRLITSRKWPLQTSINWPATMCTWRTLLRIVQFF
jgi:hypothetical protein